VRLAFAFLTLLAASVATADPLPTRDQNPLITIFDLPTALRAQLPRDPGWYFDATLNWSNSALLQDNSRESLFADVETRELRLGVEHLIGSRWAIRAELPVRYIGGGILDGFIDTWHNIFNLPEGIRPSLPHDRFHLQYVHEGITQLDLDSPSTHIGDASLRLGFRALDTDSNQIAIWLSAKLPTGSASDLSGSGSAGASLAISAEQLISPRWSLYETGGVTWLGSGDVLATQEASVVWSALTGASFRWGPHTEFKAQVEAHSAAYQDTDLTFMNSAVILTLGGTIHFQSGWLLDLGVSEDVQVEASPDVTLVFALRKAITR
jgi:Protein of unknown function (DUF3187)